jgi:hypothetical protein
MSRPDYIKDIRDLLVGEVSDENGDDIPSQNIRTSWIKKEVTFPCIIINTIGGNEIPQLGCGWAKSNPLFSIDVASRISAHETNNIVNQVKDILLQSGYEKTSEVISYDEEYEAYIITINVRLTSTYSF